MCTGEQSDFCTDESNEPAGITPGIGTATSGKQSVRRRTFLKAAALGTAAAALTNKDWRFGASRALADDLSTFQCTANDVRIVGPGQVLNEPCDCSGTFSAEVAFTVENNAASDRGCITLHMVGALLPDGSIFNPGDIILEGTIPGKTTQTMIALIADYPCGAGLVCFGSASGDGRRRCEAGECATVSWTVPGQDTCPPDKQISSKCRHQQICIQGRGSVTLDCDATTQSVDDVCEVTCGGFTTLLLCTSGGPAPYTFTLDDGQSSGSTTDLCYSFEVGPITEDTTYTGTVTDAEGCSKSASVTLTTTEITPFIAVDGTENCDGILTFSAAAEGFSDCSVGWTIDGLEATDAETDAVVVRVNSDGTLTFRALDGVCHAIDATVTCGGCTGTASTSVSQCVGTTTSCA